MTSPRCRQPVLWVTLLLLRAGGCGDGGGSGGWLCIGGGGVGVGGGTGGCGGSGGGGGQVLCHITVFHMSPGRFKCHCNEQMWIIYMPGIKKQKKQHRL